MFKFIISSTRKIMWIDISSFILISFLALSQEFKSGASLYKILLNFIINKLILHVWRCYVIFWMFNIFICKMCLKTHPTFTNIYKTFLFQYTIVWNNKYFLHLHNRVDISIKKKVIYTCKTNKTIHNKYHNIGMYAIIQITINLVPIIYQNTYFSSTL